MSDLLKNIIRFILFILIQVFILNKIPALHRFITPSLYFLYILWIPFKTPRLSITIIGFLFGLTLDFFEQTPGLHAAACTMIAYLRSFLISLLMPKEAVEISYAEPSVTSMGLMPYATYILLLTFIHHTYLIFLEFLQVRDVLYFFGKVLATTGISLLLITITEMLFSRKSRYRTNVA
jgi:rod shape-determining protein MreD